MLDLEKIQSTITGEVTKAVNADRKAIIKLIKEFNANLIDAIQNLGDADEEDDAPAKEPKAKPAKEPKAAKGKAKDEDDAPAKAAKPAKAVKAKPAKEEDEDDGDYDFTQEDLDEVDDDEIAESDYADFDVKKLKAEIKKRKISVPSSWGETELAKVLILDDEDQEDDED